MTIFRIDAETLVNAGKKNRRNKEIDEKTRKLLDELRVNIERFTELVEEVEVSARPLKKSISRLWKKADEKLKGNLPPDQKKGFTEIRKKTDSLWRQLDAAGIK